MFSRSNLRRDAFIYFSFIFLTIIIYGLAIKSHSIPLGWDQQFHLNRVEEIRYALAHHHLFPANGLHSFLHTGLAVNSFYPYLFLYPIALLQLLINKIIAFYAIMMIYTFLGFCLSFYAIHTYGLKKQSAYLFSILYGTLGYIILQVTIRADIGEYVALILFPLAFLGLKKLNNANNLWLLLPIGLALIAYSHILSIFILSITMLIELIANYQNINKFVFKRLVKSVVIFVLLTVPITFNLLKVTLSNKIVSPIAPGPLQNQALNTSNLFFQSLANTLPIKLLDINIGIVALLLYLFLAATIRRNSLTTQTHFVISTLLLFASTSIFFWFIFQKTPIHEIQFPWRFLGPASFYIALTFCESLTIRNLNYRLLLICPLILCIPILTYTHTFVHTFTDQNRVATSSNYSQVNSSAVYTDYMPRKAFKYAVDIQNHIVLINGHKYHLNEKNYTFTNNTVFVKIHKLVPNKKNIIDLPIVHYSYDHYKRSSRGTIELSVTPQKSTMVVTYKQPNLAPPLWTILLALITSICTLSKLFYRHNTHSKF